MRNAVEAFLSLVYSRTWAFWLYAVCLGHLLFRSWTVCDPDLFTRMALGRLIIESGAIPTSDPFAWTTRLPVWIDHEWLSGVVFYTIHRCFGDWGLFALKLVLAATTATVLRASYRMHAPFTGVGFAVTMLAMFGSSFVWFSTIRCQAFTYLFLAYTFYALSAHRSAKISWPLLVLPVVMIAWVNLHGGFVVGLILVGVYAAAEMWSAKKLNPFLAQVVVMLCIATLVNPYGVHLLTTVYEALAKPRDLIEEWGAVHPVSMQALLLTGALVVVLRSLVLDRGRFSLSEILMLALCFYCGYRHARLIPVALFACVSLHSWGFERLYAHVQGVFRRMALDMVLKVHAVVLFIPALLATTSFILKHRDFTLDYASYPVSAVSWAKANLPPGKMLTSFREGSYVLWSAYPKLLVSMDGRYEAVYPEETFRHIVSLYAHGTADRYRQAHELGAEYALFPRSLLGAASEYDSWWTLAYEDAAWVILTRRAQE